MTLRCAIVESLGLRVINICVDSTELGGLDAQRAWYRAPVAKHPATFSWCTSFSLDGFGERGWADCAIAQLDEDFSTGAIACKFWKNIGMDLRDFKMGEYVFVDDERFTPIFEHLAKHHRPTLMHIGEPLACSDALDPESPASCVLQSKSAVALARAE